MASSTTGFRMPELYVTVHAIERYQERVEDVPAAEITRRLNAPVFQRAADFGAPYVKLSGGQRVVIVDSRIVTVLPRHHSVGSFNPCRDHLYERCEHG
ncbi:MAG: hypothetical protein CL949_15745 [Erythrobacter sp.]|nr:hypothetical protein [Erythrobacter sp.]MAM39908.1 hypothetical protein [Erythrobacter sp.]